MFIYYCICSSLFYLFKSGSSFRQFNEQLQYIKIFKIIKTEDKYVYIIRKKLNIL